MRAREAGRERALNRVRLKGMMDASVREKDRHLIHEEMGRAHTQVLMRHS